MGQPPITQIRPGGDDWLLAQWAAGSTELALQLQGAGVRLRDSGDWLEVVPGVDSLAVQFDPLRWSLAAARERFELALAVAPPVATAAAKEVLLPVCYGSAFGPDLTQLAARLGITEAELIDSHCAQPLTVQMIGFTPGFAYCGPLDERLRCPRLDSPRSYVAPGSIGIASGQSGVYALAGPGGWPLIGRTPLTLFDAGASEPFLLHLGDQVRFRAITPAEFAELESEAKR